MRNIKLWDKKQIKFLTKFYAFYKDGEIEFYNNDKDFTNGVANTNVIVTEWTELEDKNGVEIYGGDICNFVIFDYLDNDTAYTSNVIFQQGSFGFIIKNHQNEECFYELSYILSQDDEVEVIGNIYENPDLLNKI